MVADKFELKQGRWVKRKDPGSNMYYEIDLTENLAKANTTLDSVVSTTVAGVTVTLAAAIQGGTKVAVKLSGLDISEGALNFCRFGLLCTNGEEFEATMWFERYEG